jgi:hypothetical protein
MLPGAKLVMSRRCQTLVTTVDALMLNYFVHCQLLALIFTAFPFQSWGAIDCHFICFIFQIISSCRDLTQMSSKTVSVSSLLGIRVSLTDGNSRHSSCLLKYRYYVCHGLPAYVITWNTVSKTSRPPHSRWNWQQHSLCIIWSSSAFAPHNNDMRRIFVNLKKWDSADINITSAVQDTLPFFSGFLLIRRESSIQFVSQLHMYFSVVYIPYHVRLYFKH